jgi:deazaflavin-dependent oxidoreductase (nitroreductase family)
MTAQPRPAGLDSPIVPKIIKWMSHANVWLYRMTNGRVGGTWRIGSAFRKGVPLCLLTTRGRKTGRPRTVPLLWMEDGDRVIVVGSRGGLPEHPQWYLNLQADPAVEIQIGASARKMRARTASAEERATLWPRLLEVYADFESYQAWTERKIPVVICENRSP